MPDVTQQVRSPRVSGSGRGSERQVTSGVRGWPFLGSSPSPAPTSCLRAWTDGSDQSLTPLYSPSLEGPVRAPGTPQEGTSLPPWPASCPFPGSKRTADPREKHHLGLPSTAGGTESQRPRRGSQQRTWERWGGGTGELWSEGGRQGGQEGGEGETRGGPKQRGEGVGTVKEGRRTQREEPG